MVDICTENRDHIQTATAALPTQHITQKKAVCDFNAYNEADLEFSKGDVSRACGAAHVYVRVFGL